MKKYRIRIELILDAPNSDIAETVAYEIIEHIENTFTASNGIEVERGMLKSLTPED